MIGSIISVVGNLANTFLEGKVAKSKAKAEAIVEESKARAAIAQKKATGEIDWNTKMADASDNSWKDEAWTLFFIIILTCCFIPSLTPYIERGFIVLSTNTPEWFTYGMLASIAASFGIKSISQFKK
jgi:hypothetical protein